LIIRLIIQTIRRDPSGSGWIDDPSHVSRLAPSGADQIDAEHPSRNRKVEGWNPLGVLGTFPTFFQLLEQ
jgi:hypothetical protein